MQDVPIGFAMAMSENLDAMKNFSSLSQEEQSQIILKARSMNSKQEMHDFVNSLSRQASFE